MAKLPQLWRVFTVAVMAVQAGCDWAPPEPKAPLPPEKSDFVGVWVHMTGARGDKAYRYVFTQISADGRITYQRINVFDSGHTCSTYNGIAIEQIGSGEIEAVVFFGFTVKFRIDALPREEGGVWSMTLDGDKLTLLRRETNPDLGKLSCDEVEKK